MFKSDFISSEQLYAHFLLYIYLFILEVSITPNPIWLQALGDLPQGLQSGSLLKPGKKRNMKAQEKQSSKKYKT